MQQKRTNQKVHLRIPRPYGINLLEQGPTETDSKSAQIVLLDRHPLIQDPFLSKNKSIQPKSFKNEISLISQYLSLESASQAYEKQVNLFQRTDSPSNISKRKFSKNFKKSTKNIENKSIAPFAQYSISDELKWKCGCGKVYMSYPALYLHRKNKHSQLSSRQIEIVRPVNHRKKGRPKNINLNQDWEMRIQTLALEEIKFDTRQWTILTILTNQHSISAKLADNILNRELLNFMDEFSHPFTRVCVWLLNYHLQLFFESHENKIYEGMCKNSTQSLPLMSNIIANWWNSNEDLCLFSQRFLMGLLQIFLQRLLKYGKTQYFTERI